MGSVHLWSFLCVWMLMGRLPVIKTKVITVLRWHTSIQSLHCFKMRNYMLCILEFCLFLRNFAKISVIKASFNELNLYCFII